MYLNPKTIQQKKQQKVSKSARYRHHSELCLYLALVFLFYVFSFTCYASSYRPAPSFRSMRIHLVLCAFTSSVRLHLILKPFISFYSLHSS